MTKGQKQAAAVVALILLAIPCVVIAWLAITSLTDGPLGNRFPGSFALAVAADDGASEMAFQYAPMIVAVGLSLLIPKDKVDIPFLATIGLLVIGIVAAGYLYFTLSGGAMAHRFWSYTDIEEMASPVAIAEKLRPTVLLFIGWFFVVLLAQLGIKFVAPGGE